MAYRFEVKPTERTPGFTVTVSSRGEADHIVQALRRTEDWAIAGSDGGAGKTAPLVIFTQASGAAHSAGTAAGLLQGVPMPLGVRVLEAVHESPQGVTSDTLCARFALKTGRSLGGAMIGINRKLDEHGIRPEEAMIYERSRPGEPATWSPGPRIDEALTALRAEYVMDGVMRDLVGTKLGLKGDSLK
jgi:hypothetical protein